MGYSNFKLNGTAIKNPKTFKIERYKITNLTRLAGGDMTGSLIARKRKFYFTYEDITGIDLDVILDALFEAAGIFYTLSYKENGIDKTATIYPGAIPSELHNAATGNWVWKNVNFDLIEK